jgi:hypothetical protein
MNNENTKTHFESKKHFTEFLAAWSATCNSDKAKPTLKRFGTYIRDPQNGNFVWDENGGSMKVKGCMRAEYYMLYNILRGRPQNNGFTNRTNPKKVFCGTYVNDGEYNAYWNLKNKISQAQKILEMNNPSVILEKANARVARFSGKLEDAIDLFKRQNETQRQNIDSYLSIFGGTVTVEMLANIQLEKVTPTMEVA